MASVGIIQPTQPPNMDCILSDKNVVKVIAIDIIDVPQTIVAVDLPQCYTRKFYHHLSIDFTMITSFS